LILEVAVVVLAVLALNAVAVSVYLHHRGRRRLLVEWAALHGLTLVVGRDWAISEHYPEFPVLRKGTRGYARNRFTGRWQDRWIQGFDYTRYRWGLLGYRGRTFSAVIIRGDIPLKPLYIRSRTFSLRLSKAFPGTDVKVGSQEFQRRFQLMSPDRDWVHQVVGEELTNLLISSPEYGIQFGSR